MNILGIETSCDETACAVVKDGRLVLSNIVTSSLKEHKRYGGIIPEIASRRQLEWINVVVKEALSKADLKLSAIDGFAVTQQPGLIGSLLVGISYARGLSYSTNKPLVDVDHVKAHIYANFLKTVQQDQKPKLPAIGLVVSGGHSNLFYILAHDRYRLLGQTRDDAIGEAFDKVARILGLGYPGGPIIDRLAQKGKNDTIRFNCAQLENSFDFSFSGIKTGVLYHKQKHEGSKDYSESKIAYAFQDSVTKVIVKKSIAACLKNNVKTLLVGGGVAANSMLRKKIKAQAEKNDIDVFFPSIDLCIDNAAMIAGLGYHLLKKHKQKILSIAH